MNTEDKPEKIIAMNMRFLWRGGKFPAILAEDQSSTKSEAAMRMGIDKTLL